LAGAHSFLDRIKSNFTECFITILCREEFKELVEYWSKHRINELTFDPNLPILIINGLAVYTPELMKIVEATESNTLFVHNESPVALLLQDTSSTDWQDLFKEIPLTEEAEKEMFRLYPTQEVDTYIPHSIWDIVSANGEIIETDFTEPQMAGEIDERAVIYGKENVRIEEGVKVDSFAVIDARGGPVTIDKGVYIQSHSVIIGPAYIGPNTRIQGAKIREGCSFGPTCRIGGEIENSIFMGYSNKYHDGFVGHSYIGSWVNLGALTTTSDLKNNYRPIRVQMGSDSTIKTNLVKLGSFIGDHAKLGIGTLLNAGSCIGPSTNFYGGGLAPKYIPPFVWGSLESFQEYELEKALETARMVNTRRGRELPFAEESILRKIFDDFMDEREKFIGDEEESTAEEELTL